MTEGVESPTVEKLTPPSYPSIKKNTAPLYELSNQLEGLTLLPSTMDHGLSTTNQILSGHELWTINHELTHEPKTIPRSKKRTGQNAVH